MKLIKLIKLSEVINITGLGRSCIYNYMNDGVFPKSVSLGVRSVAWVESEVQDWILDKIALRDGM